MARLPRFVLPGQPQHVIQRGNNREAVFGTVADYRFYLEKLQAAAEKHRCEIHAYVLMTNHVHLLLTPHKEDGIGKLMQTLGRYYVQYYNHCYQRTGTLWEGRYKATLIDTECYLLTCMRYIELNPVRAGMVGHPSEYPWSSYRHTALGQADELLSAHDEYRRLGKTDAERQAAYRQLFRGRIAQSTLEQIRHATNKAWVLGDERFKRRIERQLQRPVAPKARGGDRKSENYRHHAKINRV
ncbi:MAG: transposase [Nitrococcus sp.]|nr:transposase [Nitrococcus sp.]